MLSPEQLEDILEILRRGGSLVCSATTAAKIRDAFGVAGIEEAELDASVRIRISPWVADSHVTVILYDARDPAPYALTTWNPLKETNEPQHHYILRVPSP